MLIDHSGKQQARDKVADQYARRGSTALPDGCRATNVLNHVEVKDAATLPTSITEKKVEERRVLRLDVPKLTDGKPWSKSVLLVRDRHREIGIGRDQVAAARDHAIGKKRIEERK